MYGKPKPQQQTSTTQVTYSPQEQAARDKIMGSAMGIYDHQMQNGRPHQYTGPRPTGPSSATMQSWGMGQQAAGNMGEHANAAMEANRWGMKDVLDVDNNKYLAGHVQAAQRPLIDQFQNAGGVLSNIRSGAVSNGAFGGSRQGIAEGLAAQGLQQQMGDISSRMYSDAYNRGLDTFDSSVKNSAMINMMQSMPAQIMSQIGSQQEGFSQQQENYDANVREQAKNGSWEPLQNLANIVYGGSNGTQTTSSSVPQQDNRLQTMGSLGLMAMMMMSDRRLKQDIKRVGTHPKGFGIYTFKMGGVRQWGVIAQEILKTFPQHVKRMPSGLLSVNYTKLLEA